jgi:hypothetical protein
MCRKGLGRLERQICDLVWESSKGIVIILLKNPRKKIRCRPVLEMRVQTNVIRRMLTSWIRQHGVLMV